jgi:hypothetical protein
MMEGRREGLVTCLRFVEGRQSQACTATGANTRIFTHVLKIPLAGAD